MGQTCRRDPVGIREFPVIVGHFTNTFMIHTISKKVAGDKTPPFSLLLAGALAPDIMDKGLIIAGIDAYPGRGVFHSALALAIIFYVAYRLVTPKLKKAVLILAGGAALHLIQDMAEVETFLWPLCGPWNFYPYLSLTERFHRLYIEMIPFPVWLGESISAIFLLGWLLWKVALKSGVIK